MKRNLRRILTMALAALLLLSLLCGCSGKASESLAAGSGSITNYNTGASMAPGAAADGYYDYDAAEKWTENDSYSSTSGGSSMLAGDTTAKADSFDKIIYSGNARIETVEFETVLDELYALVDGMGGFLESSYITGKDYYSTYYDRAFYRSASFTIRVPREAFRGFTASLEELGNLTYSSYDAQNISTAYYDTQSRLNTYRIEEERLLEMLSKAEFVSDMLDIEDRLASVRYQIESLTSTLTNWDSKINYSTVQLEVQEVKVLTPETPITRTFGEELSQSVKNSVRWLGQAIRDSIIFLAAAIPVLIIPAIIVVLVILAIRAKKRKKQKKLSQNAVDVDR